MRMAQQSAAANSIDTSTAANPQIMKAQQQAAEASMQAQQQVAQTQQQQAAELQQVQQKFQEQMAQSDQEKQMLKMQLEKQKIEADLAKSKAKMEADVRKQVDVNKGGESSQLNKLINSRLERVRKRVKVAANIDTIREPIRPGERDPFSGQRNMTTSDTPKVLRTNVAQQLNDRGMDYMASGGSPSVGVYRTSYGRPLDWVFNTFIRPSLITPTGSNPVQGMAANLHQQFRMLMDTPTYGINQPQ